MNRVRFFNTPEDWSDQLEVQGAGDRGVHDGAHVLIMRNYINVEAIYWVWKPKWWNKCWRKETKTSFGHVKYEMPLRHENGWVQKVARFMTLELRRKILAGENHLRVIKLLPLESFGITLFPHPHDSFWSISKEFSCIPWVWHVPCLPLSSDTLVLSAQPALNILDMNFISPTLLIMPWLWASYQILFPVDFLNFL